MRWSPPEAESLAPPEAMRALLERALRASPGNAVLHAKFAYLHLDRYDFAAAASSLETALELDPSAVHVRARLARCYNKMRRHRDALDLLAEEAEPAYDRGLAFMELGDAAAAEREFRAVLADDPDSHLACRKLCRILRGGGRFAEHVALCEGLAARGATNSQLFYNWGWALALAGDAERARRLLPERERIAAIDLDMPAGFDDALAEEILANPNRLSDFPVEDEANRGSKRVDNLFSGNRTDLVDRLLQSFREQAGAWSPPARDGFDPWPAARPAAARLKAWGLIQRGDDYETGHIHAGGWMSGVYYVRVPRSVSGEGAGAGCIEFGVPSGVAEAMPEAAPPLRYVPREGLLLLSPSHYQHRTIPSGLDEDRISVAFDVVPVRE